MKPQSIRVVLKPIESEQLLAVRAEARAAAAPINLASDGKTRRGMTEGTTMSETTELVARLLPNGYVAVSGSDPDPEATWQILGSTPHDGYFVRAEVAGASWTTRVRNARLDRQDKEVVVTLARQTTPSQEPLTGWILFC